MILDKVKWMYEQQTNATVFIATTIIIQCKLFLSSIFNLNIDLFVVVSLLLYSKSATWYLRFCLCPNPHKWASMYQIKNVFLSCEKIWLLRNAKVQNNSQSSLTICYGHINSYVKQSTIIQFPSQNVYTLQSTLINSFKYQQ